MSTPDAAPPIARVVASIASCSPEVRNCTNEPSALSGRPLDCPPATEDNWLARSLTAARIIKGEICSVANVAISTKLPTALRAT